MYSTEAEFLRRCTGLKRDGSQCRSWATWDDPNQLCVAHSGRHHTGPILPGPRPPLRRANYRPCQCSAYEFPHRPAGGLREARLMNHQTAEEQAGQARCRAARVRPLKGPANYGATAWNAHPRRLSRGLAVDRGQFCSTALIAVRSRSPASSPIISTTFLITSLKCFSSASALKRLAAGRIEFGFSATDPLNWTAESCQGGSAGSGENLIPRITMTRHQRIGLTWSMSEKSLRHPSSRSTRSHASWPS